MKNLAILSILFSTVVIAAGCTHKAEAPAVVEDTVNVEEVITTEVTGAVETMTGTTTTTGMDTTMTGTTATVETTTTAKAY